MFENLNVRLPEGEARCLVGGRGPALLYHHAASGPRVTAGIEALARSRTLYIPVAPGFEDAPRLAEGAHMNDLANWLGAFIDVVFGGAVDVAGHSFGAWVGCWLAVERPQTVDRLVLVSPAGFNLDGGEALEGDPATLLARAFAHPERRRTETRPAERIAANRAAAASYAHGLVCDHKLVARLGGVSTPTRVVYGAKDGVIAPSCPELLRETLRHVEVQIVEDAAHNIDVDQPEAFASAIEDFLVQSERAPKQAAAVR